MNSIDFLPASYREERARRNIAHRRWVLVLVTLLTLVGWGVARHKKSFDLARRADALQTQAEVNRQKISEMDKLRDERRTLTYQKNIQQQLDQPIAVTQTIAMVGLLMPDSCGLTNILVTTHRPDPKPIEKPDDKKKKRPAKKGDSDNKPDPDYLHVDVHGIAPDDVTVANMVNRMSDHPLFEKVTMHYSRVDESGGLIARKFHIGADIPLDRRYLPVTQTAEVPIED